MKKASSALAHHWRIRIKPNPVQLRDTLLLRRRRER
jgi:hypothetical protein